MGVGDGGFAHGYFSKVNHCRLALGLFEHFSAVFEQFGILGHGMGFAVQVFREIFFEIGRDSSNA